MTEGVWKRARRNAQVLGEEAQRLRDQAALDQALQGTLEQTLRNLPAEDFPEGLKPEGGKPEVGKPEGGKAGRTEQLDAVQARPAALRGAEGDGAGADGSHGQEGSEPDTAEVGSSDLPEIGAEERAERLKNRREEELARAVRARVRLEGPHFDPSEKPEIGDEEVKAGTEISWQAVEEEGGGTPLEAGVETRPLGARLAGKEQIQADLERLNDLWEEGRRAKRKLNVVKFREREARRKIRKLEEKREEAENEEAEAEYLDQIREQRREAPDAMEETRKIRGNIRELDRRISRQFGRGEGRGKRRLEERSTETLRAYHRKMEAAQERRLHRIKEAVEKTRADNQALKRSARKIRRLAEEGDIEPAAGLQDLLSSKRKAKHVRERRLGKAWKATRHRESDLKAIEAVLRGRGALGPEEIGRRERLERQLEVVEALSELEEDRRQIAELEAESMRSLNREARPEELKDSSLARFGLEPLARAKAAERLAERASDCRGTLRGQAAEIREGISNLDDLSHLEDLGKAPDRGFDDPVRVREDLREIARLSEAAEEAFGALYDRPEEGAKARRQFAKRAYQEGPGPDTVSYELAERELKENPASLGRIGEAGEESLWPKARRAAQAERALAEKRSAFRKAHGAAPDDLVGIAIEESCRERLRQLPSARELPPEARRQAAASLRQEAEEKSAQLETKFRETLARKYEDSGRALQAYRKNREARGAEVARDVMRNPRFYDGEGQDFALPGRIRSAEAEEKLGTLARRLREERRRAESYARIEEAAERYLPSPVADRKSVEIEERASQEIPSLQRLSIQSLSLQGATLEPIGSDHGDREAARRFAQKTAGQAQAYKEVEEVLELYQDAKRRRQIQDLSDEIRDLWRTSFRREQSQNLRATLSSEYDAEEGLPDAVSQVIVSEESPVGLVLELAGPAGSGALNEAAETIRQLRPVEGEPESLQVTKAGLRKENEVLRQAGRTAMKIDMMQGEEKRGQIMRQKKRGARLRQTTPTREGEAEKIWDRTYRMSKEGRELLQERAQRDRAARDALEIAETRAENRREEQRVSPRPEEPEDQGKSQDQQPEDQSEDESQSQGYDRRRDRGIGL